MPALGAGIGIPMNYLKQEGKKVTVFNFLHMNRQHRNNNKFLPRWNVSKKGIIVSTHSTTVTMEQQCSG